MLRTPVVRLVAAAVVSAAALPAAQFAVLASGFRLAIERYEVAGDRVRLYRGEGFTELPAAAIVGFEEEASAAPEAEPAASGGPVEQTEPFDVEAAVEELAQELRLHPDLLDSVIAAESAYDPEALSSKGAIGLMQLMPATARELEVDPNHPEENLRGGARYLRGLLERYAGSKQQVVLAIAAYNAGPGAVDRHGGVPPYPETRQFVRRVLSRFLKLAENR